MSKFELLLKETIKKFVAEFNRNYLISKENSDAHVRGTLLDLS